MNSAEMDRNAAATVLHGRRMVGTSAEATKVRRSPSCIPPKTLAVVTEALPCVRVPVLSNTTNWTF